MKPAHYSILKITPYKPGESKISSVKEDEIIKLSSNENSFGASPKAIAAMQDAAKNQHRYPDGGATALCNAISKRYNIDAEQIVCGAGSDELIALICMAFAGEDDEVIVTQHGFLMYPISAKTVGAKVVVATEKNYTTDIDAILACVTAQTKIVFVANPNNPTGSYITNDEMTRLRQSLPSNVLLVIDGAYAEFVDDAAYDSGIDLASNTANTIMIRTFSKIYGLGGLRLGWSYSSPEIVDILHRVRGPFNVSAIAQAAGIAAIEDVEFETRTKQHVASEIVRYNKAWARYDLEIFPSAGNFIMVRFPDIEGHTAADADNFLKGNGVIVRNISAYGLADCLRITIGTKEENDLVIKLMDEFYDQ